MNIASGLMGALAPPPPAAPSGDAKLGAEATALMCSQFKTLFQQNEKLYADAVKDAVKGYFGNEAMVKELNDSFSKSILQYMQNQSFKQVAREEVRKVLGEILREPIEKALKNPEQYVSVCKQVLAKKKPITGGRRTKSNRKSRKTTIKRRN
jgi:hypothetical protein